MDALVEMLAGMALPAAAAVVLAAFAIVPGLTDANLTVWSHVAMLAGMLAVTLARWTHQWGRACSRPRGAMNRSSVCGAGVGHNNPGGPLQRWPFTTGCHNRVGTSSNGGDGAGSAEFV